MHIRRRPLPEDSCDWPRGITPIARRLYLGRGLTDPTEVDYRLRNLYPPDSMRGMDLAVELLAGAIADGERILLVGDFDADGATGCALGVLVLGAMGAQVDYLTPNRFEFGYGLTPEIVAVAAERRPDLLITVDNGISSVAGVREAASRGIRVLVTDHHLPGDELPAAAAILNPNQPGCEFPSKHLAGVGVLFYLLAGLRQQLVRSGWRDEAALPRLGDFLDLVALGTVADVVPLDTNNRILVQGGLARIRAGRTRPGLLALLKLARRRPGSVTAAELGYVLGPRLNAVGRLKDMTLGIECLVTEDVQRARELAEHLDALNRERRQIGRAMHDQAEDLLGDVEDTVASGDGELPWGLCLFDARWHQGVVGILASQIKERYCRPVVAFALEKEGWLKGSGRSVKGFHMRDALERIATSHQGLVEKFGGHAMAAGLSLPAAHLEAFTAAFDAEVRRQLTVEDLQDELLTDGELAPEELDLDTALAIRDAGPWGQHWPRPLFDGEFKLLGSREVGDGHLKLEVAAADGRQLEGIFFNAAQSSLAASPARVRLVYRLEISEFRGQRKVELMVEHGEAV